MHSGAAPELLSDYGDLMGTLCARENLKSALRRVTRNKGSAGVDGMSVDVLPDHLKEHWLSLKDMLYQGTYTPSPVRMVEIPKLDGGKRMLGIPTVLDRFIQQALLQVLQPVFDPTFSDNSYGFRPGRSAHQAVSRAQEYVAQGYRHVVDMDLEKFFDRVNHDKLMSEIAKRISDKRILKLLRSYLNAGMMEGGLISPKVEGVPQGGPLSPLLSNIMLNLLDQELTRRGHCFVRYADDCNIYVASPRAGARVMKSMTLFIERRLKLRVNREKSGVGSIGTRIFRGFCFTRGETPKRRIAPKALKRCKKRIRELTRARKSVKLEVVVASLRKYLVGWRGYYGFCQTPSVLRNLEAWIRRRLRNLIWRHWKRGVNRFACLRRLGISKDLAAQTAGSPKGPWHMSHTPALAMAWPNAAFTKLGLPSLVQK